MEAPRDWVITTTGKVVRRDKAKPNDVISTRFEFLDTEESLGPYNTFPTKDEAYTFRDKVIDEYPAAFMQEDKQKPESKTNARHKTATQEEFQEMMRKEVMSRIDVFWENWERLQPADKCALFYKMFAYAFSKAPVAKAVDADADQRKADRKRQAAAEAISQGLPVEEDNNFEE